MLVKIKYSLALMLTFLAFASGAKEYSKVTGDSYIQFSGVQNKKTAFTGHFKEFMVTTNFDASNISNTQIYVEINLDSVESGSSKRDSMLKKENWFDVENTPRSYFKSDTVEAISDNIYQVSGELKIKGISNRYSFKIKIRELVDLLRLEGKLTINRLDFDLGLGSWKNPDWVRHEVEVEFDVALKP
ncbi:YceI family protein [Kangiella sediminilitoris]|uniref:YceI family protein n=1 Tax=Kangiella sediminilitoris TaxID=1144748 RepID=A0A1B3BA92_9GAMM|nr:YceI family protein [Kangiella sediminilitoris]AOE49674.1 YceI family protein [Kangiella sediminilitoris]